MAKGFTKAPKKGGSGTHGGTTVKGSGKGNTVGKTTVKYTKGNR
jgi:hypothetical protein